MKQINLQNLLSIFIKNDEDVIEEKLRETNDLMFFNKGIRGVLNYEYLNEIANNTRSDVYPQIREDVKKNFFNKMFSFIVRTDLTDPFIIASTVEDLGKEKVVGSLNELMNFFIELEEYEKCTILKDVIEQVNYQS